MYAPNPLACNANTATLDAVLILAKKAVFDTALDPLDERLATNSALWNDKSTDVEAYRALYVNIAIKRRDLRMVVIPRSNRCLKELSSIMGC